MLTGVCCKVTGKEERRTGGNLCCFLSKSTVYCPNKKPKGCCGLFVNVTEFPQQLKVLGRLCKSNQRNYWLVLQAETE